MPIINLEQEYVEKFISKVIRNLVYFKNRHGQIRLAYIEALKTSPNWRKFKLYPKLKPYFEGKKTNKDLKNEVFIKKSLLETHQIDLDIISEEMSVLGKMNGRCAGDAHIFENTYGMSYDDYMAIIK